MAEEIDGVGYLGGWSRLHVLSYRLDMGKARQFAEVDDTRQDLFFIAFAVVS